MSNQKVFCKKDGIVLQGDPRDIMLPAQYKIMILNWCRKNGVMIESPLSKEYEYIARDYFGVNLWRIRDEKQRMWFTLRWS